MRPDRPKLGQLAVLHMQQLKSFFFYLLGAIQVLRNAFFWKFDPHLPSNANNVEPHTFNDHNVFLWESGHPPPPPPLRYVTLVPNSLRTPKKRRARR